MDKSLAGAGSLGDEAELYRHLKAVLPLSKFSSFQQTAEVRSDSISIPVRFEGNRSLIHRQNRTYAAAPQAVQNLRRRMAKGIVAAGRYNGPAWLRAAEKIVRGCRAAPVMRHFQQPALKICRPRYHIPLPRFFQISRQERREALVG